MQIIRSIPNRIYKIRGERVMPAGDLTDLHERQTKSLNLAVKGNIKGFPKDFMFPLTKEQRDDKRIQFETSGKQSDPLRLQIEISKRDGTCYLPHAFAGQGVAMLSGILKTVTKRSI